jgi:hypothetical protein
MKTLILALGVVLAGALLAVPILPAPHPRPLSGPPGAPNPPCCHAVSGDADTVHISTPRAR